MSREFDRSCAVVEMLVVKKVGVAKEDGEDASLRTPTREVC
jgi:hypothetical protein